VALWSFLAALHNGRSSYENAFTWPILVGWCPRCGDDQTMDCEGIKGINDGTVAFCRECGFLWCIECGSDLRAGLDCGHWEICENCGFLKGRDGGCGKAIKDCDIIQNWKLSRKRESGTSKGH